MRALLFVTHFLQHLRNAILPCDGEVFFAAGLAHGIEHAQCTGVCGGGDEDVLAFATAAQKLRDRDAAGLAHAASFEAHIAVRRRDL